MSHLRRTRSRIALFPIVFNFIALRTSSRPTIMGSETKKKNWFSLCGVETHTGLWLLLLCSKVCPDREKNVLFAHSA